MPNYFQTIPIRNCQPSRLNFVVDEHPNRVTCQSKEKVKELENKNENISEIVIISVGKKYKSGFNRLKVNRRRTTTEVYP